MVETGFLIAVLLNQVEEEVIQYFQQLQQQVVAEVLDAETLTLIQVHQEVQVAQIQEMVQVELDAEIHLL